MLSVAVVRTWDRVGFMVRLRIPDSFAFFLDAPTCSGEPKPMFKLLGTLCALSILPFLSMGDLTICDWGWHHVSLTSVKVVLQGLESESDGSSDLGNCQTHSLANHSSWHQSILQLQISRVIFELFLWQFLNDLQTHANSCNCFQTLLAANLFASSFVIAVVFSSHSSHIDKLHSFQWSEPSNLCEVHFSCKCLPNKFVVHPARFLGL